MSENKENDRSSGYALSRSWFDFAFENQDIISPTHTAMFAWFIELNNRMGWVDKFASPAGQTMAAIGLKSYNTYKKAFDDLVKWKFVILVRESKNQYTACIIALSNFNNATYEALDKALIIHRLKQDESLIQTTGESSVKSIDSIIKPLNKETDKPLNLETFSLDLESSITIVPEINFSFQQFWDLYDKKVGDQKKIKKKWEALSEKKRELAMWYIPGYKIAQPKKQFRKNPETFLNNESWNDELISDNNGITKTTTATSEQNRSDRKEFAQLSGNILAKIAAEHCD